MIVSGIKAKKISSLKSSMKKVLLLETFTSFYRNPTVLLLCGLLASTLVDRGLMM